jgi:hypothetical protein
MLDSGDYLPVANKDDAKEEFNKFGMKVPTDGIDQTGERKLLPFKKTSITAGGDIHITTNKEQIVYWDKTFNIETEHILGNIYYKKDGVDYPVPKDAFVAFVRLLTGARIGVVTIGQNGAFELNLREEYRFAWKDDSIDFYYTANDGVVYNFNYYDENGKKKAVDLNLLYTLVGSGNIVLTAE